MVTWKGFGWSAKGFLAAVFAVFSWVDNFTSMVIIGHTCSRIYVTKDKTTNHT